MKNLEHYQAKQEYLFNARESQLKVIEHQQLKLTVIDNMINETQLIIHDLITVGNGTDK